MKEKCPEYNRQWAELPPENFLKVAAEAFSGKITLASSLGLEDQVITHMIAEQQLDIPVFMLDTGRMFQETYSLIERTRERYGLHIRLVFPDFRAVEEMVNSYGPNLFYESVENRKYCCRVRKTEPLKRALTGQSAWVTGLRKTQSVTREKLEKVMWDAENGLVKLSPLADWSLEDVRSFINKNNIPYNPLHDKGFPSIGCLPCTREVPEGGDIRDGRWWWEDPDKKECGLHR